MKRCFGRLWMVWLLGGVVLPIAAEEAGDEDLYELASDAADEEVEEADEVLADEERVYGKEWFTRERLVWIVSGWGVVQLLLVVWVVWDLRRSGRGWGAALGWVLGVLLFGVLAGLIYWIKKRKRTRVNKSVVGND